MVPINEVQVNVTCCIAEIPNYNVSVIKCFCHGLYYLGVRALNLCMLRESMLTLPDKVMTITSIYSLTF